MSDMQAFYSNLVTATAEAGGVAATTVPSAMAPVDDGSSLLQALSRLTQVSLAELTSIEPELTWFSWW